MEEKIELLKNRNFNWDIPYFTNMDEDLLNQGKEIYKLGLIKDVYLEDGKVNIEHIMDCSVSWEESVNNTNVKNLKVPLNIPEGKKIGCKNKDKFKCKASTCLIVVAAYVYHKDHETIYDKVIDVEILKEEVKVVEEETFEDVPELTVDTIFTEEMREKYANIINEINDEELIPDKVKLNFLQLVKIIINYEKTGKKGPRPLFNYAFTENTDTVNKICLGQDKCIELLTKILVYFGYLDENNLKRKYIDFKELTESEQLIDENYKEDIIILYNMHYLTEKNLNTGGSKQQEIASIIKNNFPAYILNNSDKKVFIICDKTVNVKEFFDKMQQIKLKFETLAIPDLKVNQIHYLFLKKVNNPKYGLTLEDNFEDKLMKYLSINYNYSPYKNLEFIDYLYQTAVKNSFKTDHPNHLVISEFQIFRNDDNEEFDDLANLVGLNSVKQEIHNLKAFLEFKKEKEAQGDKMPSLDLHMCFFGNPGTGKTTVARLMAGILFNLGYIRYNKCIEVEAKDLIANVQGATAMKTSEKLQEAMGGILFIDEAYAISESAYGGECIAALIKAMEDYRDDLIVILAGYRVEMLKFLEYNSGFKSRIAYTFEFMDYSNKELLQMTEDLLAKYNFTVESYMVIDKLDTIYTNARKMGNSFGNSRFVRNTVNQILRQHAINTVKEQDEDKKHRIITLDDVKL